MVRLGTERHGAVWQVRYGVDWLGEVRQVWHGEVW
jgi:hypothetical protein